MSPETRRMLGESRVEPESGRGVRLAVSNHAKCSLFSSKSNRLDRAACPVCSPVEQTTTSLAWQHLKVLHANKVQSWPRKKQQRGRPKARCRPVILYAPAWGPWEQTLLKRENLKSFTLSYPINAGCLNVVLRYARQLDSESRERRQPWHWQARFDSL